MALFILKYLKYGWGLQNKRLEVYVLFKLAKPRIYQLRICIKPLDNVNTRL